MGTSPQQTGRGRRWILAIWILAGLAGAVLVEGTAFGETDYRGPTASTVSVPTVQALAVRFDGRNGVVESSADNLFEVDLSGLSGLHNATVEVSEPASGLLVAYVAMAVVDGPCGPDTRFDVGSGPGVVDLGQRWSGVTFDGLAGGSTYCIGAVTTADPELSPTVIRRARDDASMPRFVAHTEPVGG